MKYCFILVVLLCSSLSFAADRKASCVIDERSILGRSSSGVPQVSNVDLIQITCRVQGRPWPADTFKPGFGRFALRLKTIAYQIGDDGKRSVVPSFSNVWGLHASGCTEIVKCEEESLDFSLNIPIDPADAISELRELGEKMDAVRPLSPEERKQGEEHILEMEKHPEELADIVRQYRPGHYIVECRVMAPEDRTSGTELAVPDPDRDRLWGVAHVELEILFKGRAFDKLLGDPQQRR